MLKKSYKNIKYIFTLCIIIIVLFSNSKILAVTDGDTTLDDDDDGPDVTDSSIIWHTTCYKGKSLGAINPNTNEAYTENDFTTNDKYGWCEYEKDGEKYVVMAAATHEAFNDETIKKAGYKPISYLHYFHYNDTISFKFKNMDDDTVYKGIILDTCGVSLDPQGEDSHEYNGKKERWQKGEGVQVLDVFFPDATYNEEISDQEIEVSMDGTFSSSAGEKSSEGKEKTIALLFSGFFTHVGDFFQILQNTLGTTLPLSDKLKVTYKKEDIVKHYYFKDDVDVGTANQSDLKKESDNKTTKNVITTITVPSKIDNRAGIKETVFSTNTEIPGMPIDAYSATIGKVKFFDINFFDKAHENEDSNWKFFREIVSGVSHIVLYISAILLLTMIIIRAILLVFSTLRENPEGARDAKEVMDNIVKAIMIMAFSYLIMTFLEYLYEQLLNILISKNTSRYLVRLVVDNVYSFNTNVIGYFKYMSMMPNYIAALKYSFIYWVMSIANFAWFFYMALRMFAVGLMIITVPLTAVYELSGRTQRRGFHLENFLQWNTFMHAYFVIVFMPLVVVGSYKLMLVLMN